MSSFQSENSEDYTLAKELQAMPPKLLIRFCELQKNFWDTFRREVEDYYGETPEENNPATPLKSQATNPPIPDAPRKAPVENIETAHEETDVARKLEYEEEKPKTKKKAKTTEPPTKENKPTKKKAAKKTVETAVTSEEKTEHPAPVEAERKKRGPSEYNKFISSEVERLRKEDPGLNHKVAFKMAVAGWKERGNVTPQTTNETEPPTEDPVVDPQTVALEDVC